MTTVITATSPPEQNISRTTLYLKGTTSQHSTDGFVGQNLTSTKRLSSTAETVSTTYTTTIDESRTKNQPLSSIGMSKTTKVRLQERPELTTTDRVEEKTTEYNPQRVQTSEDLEPFSRVILGLPLKYIIIAGGSCVVLALALSLLVCHLCKRRYAT